MVWRAGLILAVIAATTAEHALSDLIDEPIVPYNPTTPNSPKTEAQPTPSAAPEASPTPTANAHTQRPAKGGTPDQAQEDIHWKAQKVVAERNSGKVLLHNDVIVTQGSLKLESDHGVIYMNPDTKEVERIVATGNVRMSRYDIDPKERVRAKGKEAVFENAARVVVLKGDPELWHGNDFTKGREIRYEISTGLITAERVEGVVQSATDESQTAQGRKANNAVKASPGLK